MVISKRMHCASSFWVVAIWLTLLGCNRSPFDAQVSGTVTLDGAPIGPGVAIFAPEGMKTNPARGAIQPDGTFELKTSRDVGLSPGKYHVSLQIVELPAVAAPGSRDMRPTKSRIPAKYGDTATSGLEYDVVPGSNTIDIALTSQ